MLDIEMPRWDSNEASDVAGFTYPVKVREWRMTYGLSIGKYTSKGWRYSALDIADLTTAFVFWQLGFAPGAAVKLAHDHMRGNLSDVLNNRLHHGFWSLGAIEIPATVTYAKRVVFLDQICERIITKLALALPANPWPRSPEIALQMADAILDYIESTPGLMRWKQWHKSAVARGGNVPITQAAAELGAPVWFLLALAAALRSTEAADDITEAVRPRAPKVAPYLVGVTLQ